MKHTMEIHDLKYLDFLTNKRFEKTRSETIKALSIIEKKNLSEKHKIDKINEEDILILIKLKTFNKNIRNFTFAFIVIFVSLILKSIFPFLTLLVLLGIIVLISSFFWDNK